MNAENVEQLLAHYEKIANAPEAVGKLRRFILELAISGKLTTPNPRDEPASELLQRISAERQRLALAGEFKEPRSFAQIDRHALPFSIPVHWAWARLIEIAKVSYGFAFESSKFNTSKRGMPLVRIRDISASDTEAYFDGEYDSSYIVRVGDYLVGMDGDFNLRCWAGKDALLNQRVMRINKWRCEVDPEFVRLPLQIILDFLHGVTSQTTVKHLSAKQVNGIEIPMPPIEEQRRIVAKVNELMALCDQLEVACTKREAARDRLAAASLARLSASDPETFAADARFALDTFSSLTTRSDQVKQLRQTILNLAMRGRLVGQDLTDEPASELLSRIAIAKSRMVKAGSTKAEKPLPFSAEGKSPDLPVGWARVRLGTLTQVVTSGSRDWAKHYSKEGAIFIRMGNLSKDHYRLRLDHIQRVKAPSDGEGTRTRLQGGDILVSITGEVGMLGLVPDDFGEAYINQHTAIVRPMPELKGRFLAEFLRSSIAKDQFNAPQRGIKNSFRLSDVTELEILLPPSPNSTALLTRLTS